LLLERGIAIFLSERQVEKAGRMPNKVAQLKASRKGSVNENERDAKEKKTCTKDRKGSNGRDR
jgi:hypothetical protein